jgi:glycosyltransferase involved in cell wall biosynthesis
VVVLPSLNRTESFGMVQVEAMICGTPVIASDLPGVRVPILQTGSGLLVEPADTEALTSSLIKILQDPQEYRGHPEKLALLSTPEAVAAKYERIFELVRDRDKLAEYRQHLVDLQSSKEQADK